MTGIRKNYKHWAAAFLVIADSENGNQKRRQKQIWYRSDYIHERSCNRGDCPIPCYYRRRKECEWHRKQHPYGCPENGHFERLNHRVYNIGKKSEIGV